MDTQLRQGLEPEVGSSLDVEDSVTRVAANAVWYSPCVIWIRGGASGRILVNWLCVRGFSRCVL